jgi:hypothetical protein
MFVPGTRLFVAIDLFAALVHFLGFQAQRGNGAGIETGQADRIAGLLAIAIGAIVNALERGIDLGNQLALAITGAQFQGAVAFRAGTIGHIGMVLAFFLKVFERFAAFAQDIILPRIQLGPEIFALARIHERLVVTGPVFN